MDERLKHISETLHNIADEAYNEGFEKGSANTQNCSWEKGVREAWECVIKTLEMLGTEHDIPRDERSVMRAMAQTFEHTDAVEHTRSYVEARNTLGHMRLNGQPLKVTFAKMNDCEHKEQAEDIKLEPITSGDVVLDSRGRERCVTCVDGNTVYALDTEVGKNLYVYAMSELTKTGKKVRVRVEKEYRVKEERM